MKTLEERIKSIDFNKKDELESLVKEVIDANSVYLFELLFESLVESIVRGFEEGTLSGRNIESYINSIADLFKTYHKDISNAEEKDKAVVEFFKRYNFSVKSIKDQTRLNFVMSSVVLEDIEMESGKGNAEKYLLGEIEKYKQARGIVSDDYNLSDHPTLFKLYRDLGICRGVVNLKKCVDFWPEESLNSDVHLTKSSNPVQIKASGPEINFSGRPVIAEPFWTKAFRKLKKGFRKKKSKRHKRGKKNSTLGNKSKFSNCKKSVINHGKNKKMFYKSILGLSGFISGMALSSILVPFGVRLVGMGISGVRLISNKFPEGRVANVISNVSDSVNKWAEKHPKISAGISRCREFFKKDTTKVFVNNVARGYLVGNVVEMVTGVTPFQHLNKLLGNGDSVGGVAVPTESVTTEPSIPRESVATEPTVVPTESTVVPDSMVESVVDNSGNISNVSGTFSNEFSTSDGSGSFIDNLFGIDLIIGDVHDISGLGQGYTSSDGLNLVSLNSSKGVEVMVDKFGTSLSGETMVHFKQLNGDGYAWFKVSDVKLYLNKIYNLVSKAFGRW